MSELLDQISTTVHGCARCGGDHPNITFALFARPLVMEPGTPYFATHWATCPENGEPIVMRVLTDD